MSATIIVTYLLVVCPESMTGNVVVIRKQMAFRRQFLFILGLGLLLFLHVVSITQAFFVKPRPFSTKSTYLNSASTSCYTWPQAQVSPSPLVSAARRGTLHWTKQSYPSALRAMGSSEILLAADLKKVLSDDIYGPMFLQALFLSVSGFLAAAALAAVIIYRGDELTDELLEEAYQERDELRERVGATEEEDGTISVGFKEPPTLPATAEGRRKREETLVNAGEVNDFED